MTKILEIMLTNMGFGYQDIEKLEFIKIFQNTPQLCWGDGWPTLSPGRLCRNEGNAMLVILNEVKNLIESIS